MGPEDMPTPGRDAELTPSEVEATVQEMIDGFDM